MYWVAVAWKGSGTPPGIEFMSVLSDSAVRALYMSPEWKAVRRVVIERDRGVCRLCGEMTQQTHRVRDRASVDHIIPLRVAPELALELGNLRLTHHSCNSMAAAATRQGQAAREYPARRQW